MATTRSVARWARRPIDTGHPGFVLRPLVLGPDNVPCVTDERQAIGNPQLSVLSAVLHGKSREGVQVGTAALAAAMTLPAEQAMLCLDLILNAASASARRQLETLMVQHYEPTNPFLRRLLKEAHEKAREEVRQEVRQEVSEEVRQEGRILATAEDVIGVLDARGLRVSRAETRRIRDCRDLETLRAWLRRAATVTRTEDLFE